MALKARKPALDVPVEEASFVTGSGNVFADLGMPDTAELDVKAQLAIKLLELMRESGLTQRPLAKRFGWTQPEVQAFMKGRLSGFSTERVMRALVTMGKRVSVHVADDAGEFVVAV